VKKQKTVSIATGEGEREEKTDPIQMMFLYIYDQSYKNIPACYS
jgi:hypothetical protein